MFWHFNTLLAVLSVLVVVIYCLGSLKWVDFAKNSGVMDDTLDSGKGNLHRCSTYNLRFLRSVKLFTGVYFVGGMTAFMKMFPLTTWFFIGIESLGFCYNMVKDLHTNIPNGTVACVFTLFFSAIFIIFVSCSLSPTIEVASSLSPLDVGNSRIYGVDETMVTLFAIPATFATAFGFIFAYGKLICSLALSKLLPIELSHTTQRNSQPYAAAILGCIIGYFICLLAFYSPYIGSQLFNICVLSAFTCYISQCIGFYMLKTKFAGLKRKYRSPLGIFGAVYAGIIFSLGFISVIAFQDDNQFAFIVFICLLGVASVYYYFVAPGQVFCAEEQKVMLNAYVINANQSKRKNKPRTRNSESAVYSALRNFSTSMFRFRESSDNRGTSMNESVHRSSSHASGSSDGEDIHVIQGAQQLVYNVVEMKSKRMVGCRLIIKNTTNSRILLEFHVYFSIERSRCRPRGSKRSLISR